MKTINHEKLNKFCAKEFVQNGIPLQEKVYNTLKDFGKEFRVNFDI